MHGVLLTDLYARQVSGVHDGTRFGLLVALMLITLAAVWGYVVFPISSGPAAALAIDYVVDCDFRNDCW